MADVGDMGQENWVKRIRSTEWAHEYIRHLPLLDRSGVHGGTLGMVCLAYNAFTIPLYVRFYSHLADTRQQTSSNDVWPSNFQHTIQVPI